jgi:glutathione synthase/RimK-type ligase-like ATP-grasp enzyme
MLRPTNIGSAGHHAGRGRMSIVALEPGDSAATGAARPTGIARLSKMMFDGADLRPLWSELVGRYVYRQDDAAALLDLAVLEQLFGNLDAGLARQAEALLLCRLYRSPFSGAPALRLLAFAAPGDLGTNTPLEFLLEGSAVELHTLYVVPGMPLPSDIPEHDLAFVAVGESDANRAVLDDIARLTARWPRPVLNPPERIALLSRERLCRLLQDIPGVHLPPTARIDRARLAALGAGASLADTLPGADFPVIARPVDSHAGRGLEKLADAAALGHYLATRSEAEFFVSPFVDYRDPDGLFRKYRIVFIAGRPYACHMAVAEQWMIYYLNANMKESASKRAEEARFMARFDEEFAQRHGAALAAISERVGLDYFGIDCAEDAQGTLLLFEADIAMIVHAMDDPAIFPYKVPQMRKVFDAFRAMLRQHSEAAR